MRRQDFEHIVRAAADVVGGEIVVIGSQAVLGEHPAPPAALLRSMELDVYPRADPDRADEIDGALGDGSQFHRSFDYFAHGVGPDALHAPDGWEERLVRIEVPALTSRSGIAVAWCLETHDLALAKLAAGRPRDLDFVAELLQAGLVTPDVLQARVETMPPARRDTTRGRLRRLLR